MEPLRIEIAIHLPGGAPPIHVVSQHDVDRAAHIESGLGEPSEVALEAAGGYDRGQLLAALEAAHARDHDLTTEIEQLKRVMQALDATLATRTVERDHFKEDSLLWSLVVAKIVDEQDGELVMLRDEINGYMGRMLEAKVEDGWLHVTLAERPGASPEGASG